MHNCYAIVKKEDDKTGGLLVRIVADIALLAFKSLDAYIFDKVKHLR